jgi:hypothetical protein
MRMLREKGLDRSRSRLSEPPVRDHRHSCKTHYQMIQRLSHIVNIFGRHHHPSHDWLHRRPVGPHGLPEFARVLRRSWRSSHTPGADDNASAVAVLLEVSRLLREHQCKRSIRYVAFAYEEPLVRGEKLKWLRLFKVCSLVTGCVWLADECQLAHAASFFKVDLV